MKGMMKMVSIGLQGKGSNCEYIPYSYTLNSIEVECLVCIMIHHRYVMNPRVAGKGKQERAVTWCWYLANQGCPA